MDPQSKPKVSLYFILGVLLLFIGFAVGMFLLPFVIKGDASARYTFMDTLVHQLKLSSMRYSMVGPLFSLPLWWISGLFRDPMAVIARYNYLLFATFLVILFLWLRSWFDQKFLLTFILLLAFGSMFPGHLINYYGEVFSAVFLTLGTLGLVAKKTIIGWVFLILAVLNTPALFVAFALLVLYSTWEARRLRYLLLLPICIVLLIVEAYLRTGSLTAGFTTYLLSDHGFHTILPYSGKGDYSYPFILGVLSILFSFGKGLIFFCPGLLLIIWVRKLILNSVERKLLVLWFLVILGLVIAYASWWSWYGGWYWGPRFFLFVSLPASWILARAVHAPRKSLLLVTVLLFIVTLSIWVGVNGVVFQQNTLDACTADNYALEFMCWYVPEFSVLIRPFIAHAAFRLNDTLIMGLFALVWLFIMVPLAREFVDKLKAAYQSHRPLVNFSEWKL